MSLLLRTIEAFPRGRTTEELLVLLDKDFDFGKRASIQSELGQLFERGLILKHRDGKWRATIRSVSPTPVRIEEGPRYPIAESETLTAVPARIEEEPVAQDLGTESEPVAKLDPHALLRYWRSALRSDPRGGNTETPERHGTSWQLITCPGPLVPSEGIRRKLSIILDHLNDEFRKALLRRSANEQTMAIGWPVAVGRKDGTPAIWPVGVLAAEWRRVDDRLEIVIDADDVLVNPDWMKATARSMGWTERQLRDMLADVEGVGLPWEEFATRLKEAAAGAFRTPLTGRRLVSEIDPSVAGIYDIAALFLPSDSSFTAGAVQNLDAIATWPLDKLSRTALAPVLGLPHRFDPRVIPVINTGPLNAEQIAAVRNACSEPLSVVTGPPGTGKSQAIVSIVATMLSADCSVVVASKNHQALDAVENRLKGLAPEAEFLVRTLDPAKDIDRSFKDVLSDLVNGTTRAVGQPDVVLQSQLKSLCVLRERALDLASEHATLHCEIAELIERIEGRLRFAPETIKPPEPPAPRRRWWHAISQVFSRLVTRRDQKNKRHSLEERAREEGAPLEVLRARLAELRANLLALAPEQDPVSLTIEIADLARRLTPAVLSRRAAVPEATRLAIAEEKDNLDLAMGAVAPSELVRSVIGHRPLWLTSVLGTPKRIPLEEGLFDLLIIDEASQCDIASALPLFARAKRAVVVGDDRQLSFIAQLGIAHDRNLMQAQALPVGNMGRFAQSRLSLFDFASRIPGIRRTLLRDQYRSTDDIVSYISNNFYGGQLRASYDPASIKPLKGTRAGIDWKHVPAPQFPIQGNINTAEVDEISRHLHSLLVDQRYDGTVGVISPFRSQVAALSDAIHRRLSADVIKRADLRIGTVDGFQGQERDLVLFSPCVGPSSATSAVTFLQRDWRRLNVAISRARAIAHVFGDLDFARSGKIKALARLAAFATEPRQRVAEGVFDSEWERRVYHALKDRGLEPVPQYEIAGRRLDFALFGRGDIKLDLEIDGRQWHSDTDGRRKLADHWRDHQLKSLGWRVRRFWVDELAKDMEACLELVERDIR